MNAALRLVCPLCGDGIERPPLAEQVTCPRCATALDVAALATARGRPRFVAQADLAGESIGPYRLVERLGAGGAGTVYRAVGPGGGEVALKVLDPSLSSDEAARERFRREARLLADLAHPRIVQLRDHGESGPFAWLAMEYVAGTDLRTRLRTGPLPPSEAAPILAGLLDALAFAHARGVVHRDIKPANILLGGDGPKLADFGIARLAEGPAAAAFLTATEAVLGTILYMAPEQRAGGAVDARADLFSVGVVLYEALTGRLPQGAFSPPSRVAAGVPAAIDGVVRRLLQPEPALRYADAGEAARAVARALAPRRTKRLAALAAGVAGAAAIAIGLLVRGPSPTVATIVPADAAVPVAIAAAPIAVDAGAPDLAETIGLGELLPVEKSGGGKPVGKKKKPKAPPVSKVPPKPAAKAPPKVMKAPGGALKDDPFAP